MSKHMKRLAAPRAWKIPRKTNVYTMRPRPGAHPIVRAVPLGIVLRDYLKLALTRREISRVVGDGEIRVDGRATKDPKHAVGFMDVVHVPRLKSAWRAVLDGHGRLDFVPVPEKDATWKLCRITDKTTVRGGLTQLNLHDGRNLLVKKDDYATGDTLRLEVPSQKVLGHFPLAEGAEVLVTGGQHVSEVAPILKIEPTRSSKPNLVHLRHGELEFATIKPYAFPIGERGNLPKAEVKSVV